MDGYLITLYRFLTHQTILEVTDGQQMGTFPDLDTVSLLVIPNLPAEGVVMEVGGGGPEFPLKLLLEFADAFGGLIAPFFGFEIAGDGFLPGFVALLGSRETGVGRGRALGGSGVRLRIVSPWSQWVLDAILVVDALHVGFEELLVEHIHIVWS